jgi:uncharacterized protein
MLAVILFLVPISLNFMTYYGMPTAELNSTFAFFYPSAEEITSQTQSMRGSYDKQMPLRVDDAIQIQTIVFVIEMFWRSCAMMFLGMILYRKGILSAEKSTIYYRKLMWVGFIPCKTI